MATESQPFELRRATPDDQAGIEALVHSAYAKWVPVIGGKPLPMRADYAAAIRNHRIDLHIVGTSLVALIETALEADHLLIVNIAVTPAAQGQGIGARLLQHAEQLAIEAGKAELRLYTNRLMVENIALYRRRGYLVSREEHVQPGRTVVHMVKPV
ncbi:MAG: family N-acetyltransferase [Hyphomicrobiales bacterium]|nr:family N-acetyltransferase [Hyphomicrobiales bacterium]